MKYGYIIQVQSDGIYIKCQGLTVSLNDTFEFRGWHYHFSFLHRVFKDFNDDLMKKKWGGVKLLLKMAHFKLVDGITILVLFLRI